MEKPLRYKELLKESLPDIEIIMWDERLSTMAAERSLLKEMYLDKKEKVIDKMAAVFILQGYLDSIQ